MPALAASVDAVAPPRYETVVRADQKSGRLVRRVIAQVTGSTQQPASLVSLVDRIAAEQGVERSLVHSVIRAESNYNPAAVSDKGALGIMQLIPSTARRFGVANVFDPADNIQGGVKYLKFLLDYYQGDYPKVIAAYNAGEGAVDKYRGVPPFAETREYVVRVAKNLKSARAASAKEIATLVASPNPTVAETRRPIQASVGEDGRTYYRTP